MIISLIVAYDQQRGIGLRGRLPWHIPAELKLFKRITWGHHLVMGRRTYESIGRALPGRTMLVVTSNTSAVAVGCIGVPTLEAALHYARDRGETECFVIGGAMLYAAALPLAQRLYISEIEGTFNCDTFFPPIDERQWHERFSCAFPAEAAAVGFRFRVLDRLGTELPLPAIATELAMQQ